MTSSNVIFEESRLKEVVDYFLTQPMFAFDFETTGENRGVPHLNDISWLSMATKGTSVVIPMGHPIGSKVIGKHREPRLYGGDGPNSGKTYMHTVLEYEAAPPQISKANVFDIIRPLFFSEHIIKSAHGAVFDIASCAKDFGEVMVPPYNCSIVSSWLLSEDELQYGLKYQVHQRWGFDYDSENIGRCVERFTFNKVAYYSYCDALYAYLIAQADLPQVKAQGLWPTYELEMDVLNVLVGMRLAGSPVDKPRLEELKTDLSERVDICQEHCYDAAGRKFNLNSTPQKKVILFSPPSSGGQGLEPWKLTKAGKKQAEAGDTITGWSTDDEVLQSYPTNPVAMALRNYQEVYKLLSTYIIAYLGDGDSKPCQIYDGSIYADFVQYGTNTGRFSCRQPNLQNIPRPDTDLGKLIRGAWRAEPGYKLVVGDYGQIELVIFAHYAGHGALYEGFWNGLDPHAVTAARILGKEVEEVASDERQYYGKVMNFAMSFGAGLNLVASMLGVDKQTAKHVLEAHRLAFPEIYDLKQSIINLCRSREPVPYVKSLAGHTRRLPDINLKGEKNAGRRYYAERQAVSAVIQGSAAALIKMAMVRFDSDPRCGDDIQLVLTVHDELVAHCPEDRAETAAEIMREAMLGDGIQQLIRVPLSSDIKVVQSWSQAK